MTSAVEIVPASKAELEALDPSAREAAVTRYLEQARDQLAVAVQMTGPEAVAQLKAEIATAAEATRQLGLSKEIQQDAQEMVRRAEYALGKAIRAGQERGEIIAPGKNPFAGNQHVVGGHGNTNSSSGPRPVTDFASRDELSSNGAGIYALADDVAEPEFEAALSDARAEGNLSRANVVRKIKGVKSEGLTPVEKLAKIRELAPRGYTSGQIAEQLGCTESYVRDRAREIGVEITADKVLARRHRVRVDHDHIVNHLVTTLEVLTQGIERVDINELDDAQMQYWADSLTASTRVLNRFVKQIKEKAQ